MKKNILLAVFGMVLFILLTTPVRAMETDAIALISSFSGDVKVNHTDKKSLQPLHLGMQLFENDEIYTYDNSKASLLFIDGSVITVWPNSQLKVVPGEISAKKEGTLVATLSRKVLTTIKGIFSGNMKEETLTAIPGIRKKIEKEKNRVTIAYPRNSIILSLTPTFRWKISGDNNTFLISLTLKGMEGTLWAAQTDSTAILYPEGQKSLKRGQTYFLKVQSANDSSLYDEVYFRILEQEKATEVIGFEKKMMMLQKSNRDDMSPSFILATFYKGKGLFHQALIEFERLEKQNPEDRFILEQKREIFAKTGLWEEWETVNRKLTGMN